MKRCPECRRDYLDDSLLYCLDDGTALLDGPASDGGAVEPLTAKMRISVPSSLGRRSSESATRVRFDTKHSWAGGNSAFKWGMVAMLIIGTCIGAFFAYRYLRAPAVAPPRTDLNLKIERLTGNGKVSHAAISPDGKFLAYSQSEAGTESLWVKQISTNSNVQIVAPSLIDKYDDLVFTPDGSFVYFTGKNTDNPARSAFRVPTLGGSLTKGSTNAYGISFSPDGKQYVFARGSSETSETELVIANADGSNERQLASKSGHQFFTDTPTWSPDGKMIACPVGDDTKQERGQAIAVIDVLEGKQTEIGPYNWDAIGRVAWLPDMSGLMFSADQTGGGEGNYQLWRISYPDGASSRLTQNLTDYEGLTMTADGRALVAVESAGDASIWVSPNADVTKAVQITTGKDIVFRGIAWTPDKRVVYVSSASGNTELWIMDSNGSNQKQLTNDGRIKYTPVVSPDGRFVVYASSQVAPLWRVSLDGTGAVPLVEKPMDAANPDISPDGSTVVFSSWNAGKLRLWRVPIEGGQSEQLTQFAATEPNISPDGKSIAYFFDDGKNIMRMGVIPFEGGEPVQVFDVPTTVNIDMSPKWTPDAKAITFVDNRGGRRNLWLQPVTGGPAKQVTDYRQDGMYRREWTRDGKQVAIVLGGSRSDVIKITEFR